MKHNGNRAAPLRPASSPRVSCLRTAPAAQVLR